MRFNANSGYLRFANVVIGIWLGFECLRLIAELLTAPTRQPTPNKVPCELTDAYTSPATGLAEGEAVRLSEWLARAQYTCQRREVVGGSRYGYPVCLEVLERPGTGRNLLVTGLVNAAGEFEASFNDSVRWAFFGPHGAAVLDAFQSDVEVSYLPEILEERRFPIETIVNSVAGDHFDVAKLELYSEAFDAGHLLEAPQLLLDIATHLSTRLLLFEIRIEALNATEVVPAWLEVLNHLFYSSGYAQAGAQSNGACLPTPRHCVYRVAFIKTTLDHVSHAPVFGMGSPGEERLRLLAYLARQTSNTTSATCVSPEEGMPRLCSINDSCHVLYLRYEASGDRMPVYGSCSVDVIAPDRKRHLIASSDQKTSHLVVDLDGDELQFVQNVLDASGCEQLKKFSQIAFRLRIYLGEDSINYRTHFLRLLRLESCGFEPIFHSRPTLSTVLTTFVHSPTSTL